MKSVTNLSLQSKNSFAVNSICPCIYYPSTLEDLEALPQLLSKPFYILGEGSNTLFVDATSPLIIKPQFTGVSVKENKEHYLVTAAASENWHALVKYCIDNNYNGLENLALIPGSVGAAPVQNIGAYGVELSDFLCEVSWFEFESKKLHQLTKEECLFSYRESIFKNALKNKGIIIDVTLALPKRWLANISYQGLDHLSHNVSAVEVMENVITLRNSKLPMPDVLPNAGSFFKNPIVNNEMFLKLQSEYPKIPFYPISSDKIKLAAGWLIEQAELKGYRMGNIGVHKNQALVIVNYGSDSGEDVVALASHVQKEVMRKFKVTLQAEVRAVYAGGETEMKLNRKVEN